MTGEGWAAIILALGTFLTVVTNTVIAFAGLRKSAGNAVKITEASAKIDEVHKLADGLSSSAQTHAHDAGVAQGEAKARADMVAEAGADALARERGRPIDTTVGATVETAVVRALDTATDKSLDKVAGAVADKVAEKVAEKVMEKKP